MKNPILNSFTIFLLIIALGAFIFSLIEVVILKTSPSISLMENGVLELSQVILLLGTIIMYTLATLNNNNNERWISLFFATIFYIFLLRELGVKHMDVPDYIKFLFNGTGRTITAAILFAIAIINSLRHFKHYFNKTIELLFSKRGILLWASFAFLQVGQWMEKVDIPYAVLYEESLELIGYCLILLCAYKTLKIKSPKKSKR